ncbi:MAG: DUF3048 domain-containing protein [Candidatus Levyibacteriota bacterium]|nr:MAG: DUF3048 domain-containing protein [Candidatus Levybacteria bacterium]
MHKKKIQMIVIAALAYLLSAEASYAIFSRVSPQKQVIVQPVPKTTNGSITFDDALPKTEECPMNGQKYSEKQREWWEKHRPLTVMIENHENSRPQSGLTFADIVYEAVAEGGITRFMAVYYCQDANPIGPVRSARTYFIDFASEYGESPLYAHVGGANTPGPADALSQLTTYEWTGYNDLNQFSIGFPTFWRDYDRLGYTTETEHTMYSTTTKLWDFAKKQRGLSNVDKEGESWDKKFIKYLFKDDKASAVNQTIHLEFWDNYSAYFADWTYDKQSNSYKRSNGGKSHIDNNTKKQLTTKNIVVLFMQESNANDGYEDNLHLLYKTKGTGKAQIYMDGKEIKGTWRKDSRTGRTLIFDSSGDAIKFNRGKIWFEILPTTGVITVK